MKAASLIKGILKHAKQTAENRLSPPLLEYAPNGWKTVLHEDSNIGWNASSVVSAEKEKWDSFCEAVNGHGPLGFSHEHTDLLDNRVIPFHNVHITYGYVLALAAHLKSDLSVLDYGGGLGHYFQLGKTLLPDVKIEFSCKEVSSIAAVGKNINPDIRWFTDDSCLEKKYDIVMVNGSLQYMEHWQEFIRDISTAVGSYFFLTRVPTVENSESFVAVQKAYNTKMLHGQFNKQELLRTVTNTGLSIVREFVVGDRPYIKNAPEQCELRGWLFKKNDF